jgi:elongation factor G
MAMMRILQGKLDNGTQFLCGSERKQHKAGHVLKVEGRDHPEVESVAYAGDIVALAKVDDIHVDMVLHAPGTHSEWEAVRPKYPTPMFSLAIAPANRNDEVKLNSALTQLCEEDPTLTHGHDPGTKEMVISGMGEIHLKIAMEKLESRFRVAVTAKAPQIAYRETITAPAEGHHRHKKQTGGAGQFGEVFLRVEPLARGAGFEFHDETRGGSIPNQFIPSVEKGVRKALESGPLAGFGVHDVRVAVYDGKTHPVDGKDVAFQTAGKVAFRDAFGKARPQLLEPIVSLEITVPEKNVGDITADLKTRRGRVVAMDLSKAGMAVIRAHAPLSELGSYSGQLRGLTGGQAQFVMEPLHYDFVPPIVAKKIMEAHKPGAPEPDEE